MLHLHELGRVVVADREREIRERAPRDAGLPSGRRHPAAPETSPVEEARAALVATRLAARRAARPRAAFNG